MISLYPSHIRISFLYSHILPYPYISHISVSIFLSVPPVALPLVFFHFCGVGTMCVFLVVFFGVGVVDGFRIVLHPVSRFALRFVPSLVPPFCSFFRFALRPAFRSASSFRFLRFGVSDGRFWGSRRFCQLFVAGGRFVFFRASVSWRWRILCRIVDGGGSAGSGACRVAGCGACRSARRQAGA